MKKNRALILIDGVHRPDNTIESIRQLQKIYGFEVKKLIWAGGTEKIKTKSSFSQVFEKEFCASVIFPEVSQNRRLNIENALRKALKDGSIETVVQLCGAPQVFRKLTNRFASIAVSFEASYIAGGTTFKEYRVNINHNKPSIGLYATDKRVGKTAFGSYIGCLLSGMKGFKTSWAPIIITHSRGGPPEPFVLEIYRERLDKEISEITLDNICTSRFRIEYLERLLDFDFHGASDVFEDAFIMSVYIDAWESSGKKAPAVSIIGCRRAGAGYFQEFTVSNVEKGISIANEINGNIIIHEGSGGEHPPVKVDGSIYFVPSDIDLEMLEDFPGIESAGLIIIANCQEENSEVKHLLEIERIISARNPETDIIWTRFVPEIIGDASVLKNKNVVFLTTAPKYILKKLAEIIQSKYGCRVIKTYNCLDSSEDMLKSIDESVKNSDVDFFLFEIKAQGVEGARYVQQNYSKEFFYVNNIPQEVDRNLNPLSDNKNLDVKILEAVNTAVENFNKRK